jgi:hypothetical protein
VSVGNFSLLFIDFCIQHGAEVTVIVKAVRHWDNFRENKFIRSLIAANILHFAEPCPNGAHSDDQRLKAVHTVGDQYLAASPPGHLESARPLVSIDASRKAQAYANFPAGSVTSELMLQKKWLSPMHNQLPDPIDCRIGYDTSLS